MDIIALIISIVATLASIVAVYYAWDAKKSIKENIQIETKIRVDTFKSDLQWLVIDVKITNTSKTKPIKILDFYLDNLYGRNRVKHTLGRDVIYAQLIDPTLIVPSDCVKFTLYFSLPSRYDYATAFELLVLSENQRFCKTLSFVPNWNE